MSLTLSGCQVTPSTPPASNLRLLESAALQLAADCHVEGMVHVGYTVMKNGRTRAIEISPAPQCARDALAAWVASYRYAPPTAEIATQFEWMLVSGRRGS